MKTIKLINKDQEIELEVIQREVGAGIFSGDIKICNFCGEIKDILVRGSLYGEFSLPNLKPVWWKNEPVWDGTKSTVKMQSYICRDCIHQLAKLMK